VAGFVEDLKQYHYLDRLLLVVILVDAECIELSERTVQVTHRRQILGLSKPLAKL
jgi:hypothetical protein